MVLQAFAADALAAAGFIGAVAVFHIIVFKTFSHFKTPVYTYVFDRLNEKKCIISNDSLFDISLPELFIKNVYIYFNFSIFSMFLFMRRRLTSEVFSTRE